MNIIHKLGLYRASEVEELIETTNEVVETAALNNKCFKVAMRLVNEANSVEYAMDVLKAHCGNQPSCIECEFNNGECVLAHTAPCSWEV